MKIFKQNNYEKGTSLIELLVYFALLSIVMIVVVDLVFKTSEFSLETNTKNSTQNDARFIIHRLNFDIKRADLINTPSILGETSTELILTIAGETITYKIVDGDLILKRETASNTTSALVNSKETKLNNISFKRLGSSVGLPKIKISFDLENLSGKKGGADINSFTLVIGNR